MFASGQLKEGEMYDVDFDHQFIETEKYDEKLTYKKFFDSGSTLYDTPQTTILGRAGGTT